MKSKILLAIVSVLLITVTSCKEDDVVIEEPILEPYDISLASLVGQPAETNSLNGVSVSPVDGTVYVASLGGNEITIHDPETGKILDRLGPEDGVNAPDDVFVTDDGTVYWTTRFLVTSACSRLTEYRSSSTWDLA